MSRVSDCAADLVYIMDDHHSGDRADREAHVIDQRYEASLAIFAKWIVEAMEADSAVTDRQSQAGLTNSPDSPLNCQELEVNGLLAKER